MDINYSNACMYSRGSLSHQTSNELDFKTTRFTCM